jgi:hypothetical protein
MVGRMHIASKRKYISTATSCCWAETEFSRACLPDQRLIKRLVIVASDFLDNINSSIPFACGGDWAKTKATYRFFDNESVTPDRILSSHQVATIERMENHEVVLAIQDTTTLNYSHHPRTEGIGLLGSHSDKTLGVFLHTTMAVSVKGVALGIVDAQTWSRPVESRGKAKYRSTTPLEQKESYKWLKSFSATVELAKSLPRTQVISVADREGDIYELLIAASTQPNVGILVRAHRDRPLEGELELSWAKLAGQALAGTVNVIIPRTAGKAQRIAQMEIRFIEATLRAPQEKKKQGPVVVWMVEGREVTNREEKPLLWRLITTVPVLNFGQAAEKLRWYEMRWIIEEFHRVLKSGCAVESRQLETVERIKKVLMLDMVVAWKVLELTRMARQEPESPAGMRLGVNEVEVLKVVLKIKPQEVLQMRKAVRQIGKMGGFLGRKSDGEPGVITIWRGLKRLDQLVEGYLIAKNVGNA